MNAKDEGQQWEYIQDGARMVRRDYSLPRRPVVESLRPSDAVDRLNALQQQVTELEGKAALLKEVVDWSPHESWIRKRYAALTSPSTIAQKEMVQ